MPYLLVTGPEFSLEQRKIMAAELTDAVITALQLPKNKRDWITVHFTTYPPDHVSVGGRLLSEIEERSYYCQFLDVDLTLEKKEILNAAIFPLLMELLGLDAAQAKKIRMLFQSCSREDVVIGGRFLSELQ